MSERFSKHPAEKPSETFSDKKDAAIAYLKHQIAKFNDEYTSFQESGKSAADYHNSTPPLGRIPEEVIGDGGSDLSEWKAQVGADKYEREHGGDDRRERMEEISRDLQELEGDLQDILAMQEDPDREDYERNMHLLEVYAKPPQK